MVPLVEIRKLSRRFGATRALTGASLSVCAGEVHCLLGENGAGKSTLGKILAGLIEADEGKILLNGKPITNSGLDAVRDLGVTLAYQELSLVDDLSVAENLSLGREQSRHPWSSLRRSEEREHCIEQLQLFGLNVSPDTCIGTLAAGQRQLIEVAKALSSNPRLVVLDEPTATLNAVEKERLFCVLKQLKAKGMAFVLVTHHVDDVLEIGDHVTLLKNGEVVDSFAMSKEIAQADLLEKLCGKRSMARTDAATKETNSNEPLISLKGLLDKRGDHAPIEIPKGKIIALYGVVGCGNQRVARSFVGLDNAPELSIWLHGKPYKPRAPYKALQHGVSYLAPKRAQGILPDRSVKENINLSHLSALSHWGWIHAEEEDQITLRKIDELNVKCASSEMEITSLSGGNQQKVLIGRTLSQARDLIVLEEPSAGIDIGAKLAIHDILRRTVHESGLSILLVSSDISEILALADVVYTMFHGHIVNCYEHPTTDDQADIIFDILGDGPGQRLEIEQGALT
ncbi:sugar ABC transporter ATP-binding protein [Paenalcaligenes niemegkensis]|uniref:sugar ABC transporter ATP-binding protein n=1 Tax=Paenalcaligenes niemegkensis TaxID=2895469 RepID=UPI001EE8021F|nr:sugar ABC transporter ATP-binding protein [Paenalcaligenes niemegkensis]MCQ9617549.1 sugar ABC transporter ATP-binding protein [Paenalcaligenes niemegkensis]